MMESWYTTIDFEEIKSEMDSEDYDDFATLFLTRDELPKLKEAIDTFTSKSRTNNYYVPKSDKAYQDMDESLKRLSQADSHKWINYRTRIKKIKEKMLDS